MNRAIARGLAAFSRSILVLTMAAGLHACGGPVGGAQSPAIAAANVSQDDVEPSLDAACASDDDDCCNACLLVHECRPAVGVSECEDRCLASNWYWQQSIHCLALRVFWIDEEHCPRVGPTWDNFDDDDNCTGVGPDVEGYGPF